MGCNTSKTYIAKETYHPYDNEWEGFTTQSYEESRVNNLDENLISKSNTKFGFSTFAFILIQPLRIECGQKLKMIERETGLVAPDRMTTLYRMRYADNKNVITNLTNIVCS